MSALREISPHSCPTCGQDVSHAPNHVSEEDLAAILDGHGLVLTKFEARLLLTLLKRSPRPVHSEALIGLLWPDPDHEPLDATRTLQVHLCKLSRKLRPCTARIENILGVGYRLVAQ